MIFLVEVLRNIVNCITSYCSQIIYRETFTKIQTALGENILTLSNRAIDNNSSGVFIQRLTNDTDRNEFLVYLVGYEEKQIMSYIKKLNKEFKNLPYDYGAKIGHSMIVNDLKSVEDAINESVEDMKLQKEEN